MPNYLMLIYRDEAAAEAATGDVVSAPYREFMARHGGRLRGGAALEPSSTATSVRRRDEGSFAVTDGVFAESKEALGGDYGGEAGGPGPAPGNAQEGAAPVGGGGIPAVPGAGPRPPP